MASRINILLALVIATATTAPASARPAEAPALDQSSPGAALVWCGEKQWTLALDGEKGTLRLGFIQTPTGDYLVTGDLVLDDAKLGVTGSARRDGNRLVMDITTIGAVSDVPPDAGKTRLFAAGEAPARISATGFAVLHAVLDAQTLAGTSLQYQTNVVTGDHVQGPVLRKGTLVPIGAR